MNKKSKAIEFLTEKNRYIYDAVSGEVIPAKIWSKYIIDNFYKLSKEEMMVNRSIIDEEEKKEFGREYNLIKNLVEEKMFFFSEEVQKKYNLDDYIFNANSSQLILVLTGKCNMRCEYCVYCEKYPQEIGYSNDDMCFETAKKGIDLYFELHTEKIAHGYQKPPMINFYGGEPLLMFGLIQSIVQYVEQIDKSTKFYITTNGLILNEEMADFISRHKFSVTFSLDGFKENHDRNRVITGGGPTFDIILEKIKMLQTVKRRNNVVQSISFNCCFDNYTDIKKCIEFFDKNYDEFFPFFILFNQINPYDTSYYTWTKERIQNGELLLDEKAFNKSYTALLKNIFEETEKGHEKELSINLFTSMFMLHLRNRWSENPFNNSCIPLSKMAVYPKGELCLCEKMNKKFIIGDVFEGIDYEKVIDYTQKLTNNFYRGRCSQCEVRRTCSACFMYMDDEGNFNKEFCKRQRKIFKNRLMELYQVLEGNSQFIENMKMSQELVDILEMNN